MPEITYDFDNTTTSDSPRAAKTVLPRGLSTPKPLTKRELSILACFGSGIYTTKEISARLGISAGVTKVHVHHVMQKTNLSRIALAVTSGRLLSESFLSKLDSSVRNPATSPSLNAIANLSS